MTDQTTPVTDEARAARKVWEASRGVGEPLSAIASDYIAAALADDGLLMPDLPEPDNAYPEWSFENLSISPGIDPGEVAIEWEDREDTGRGTVGRSRYLAPDQVLALLAAANYAERNQN